MLLYVAMTIREALQSAQINSLDAEVLLSMVLECDRSFLLSHPDVSLTKQQLTQWNNVHERRQQYEPTAYITGRKEFCGHSFVVDARVLIPRPSTEGLIEVVSTLMKKKDKNSNTESVHVTDVDTDIIIWSAVWNDVSSVRTIVDIGTGSGCIAVTLAKNLPKMWVIATDISPDAVKVAEHNVEQFQLSDRIDVRCGSLLEPLKYVSVPFLLVSNPPYIPAAEKLMPDVQDFEPHQALFGGNDGSDAVVEIVRQAKEHPYCCGVVVECRSDHVQQLQSFV